MMVMFPLLWYTLHQTYLSSVVMYARYPRAVADSSTRKISARLNATYFIIKYPLGEEFLRRFGVS